MGSDSDLGIMHHSIKTLDFFGVPNEYSIESAHRTPDEMRQYAMTAESRGLQAIIAGAGGSAHLPGMTAAYSELPVLAVAIESQPDPTNAALGSMIRMPEGAPLAVMGINKPAAVNAALFVVRMLARHDPELAERSRDFYVDQATGVIKKKHDLVDTGYVAYMSQPKPGA